MDQNSKWHNYISSYITTLEFTLVTGMNSLSQAKQVPKYRAPLPRTFFQPRFGDSHGWDDYWTCKRTMRYIISNDLSNDFDSPSSIGRLLPFSNLRQPFRVGLPPRLSILPSRKLIDHAMSNFEIFRRFPQECHNSAWSPEVSRVSESQ